MVNKIRFEDRLEGTITFVSWKLRLIMILREQESDSFVENTVLIPNDENEKIQRKKC